MKDKDIIDIINNQKHEQFVLHSIIGEIIEKWKHGDCGKHLPPISILEYLDLLYSKICESRHVKHMAYSITVSIPQEYNGLIKEAQERFKEEFFDFSRL